LKSSIFWDIALRSFDLLFNPEDGGHVPPKRRVTVNRVQGTISQKTELFITIPVRTSNPADTGQFERTHITTIK
jgi:hypothetical protein